MNGVSACVGGETELMEQKKFVFGVDVCYLGKFRTKAIFRKRRNACRKKKRYNG